MDPAVSACGYVQELQEALAVGVDVPVDAERGASSMAWDRCARFVVALFAQDLPLDCMFR